MCPTEPISTTTEPLFKRPELLLHPNIPKPLHGLAPRTLMSKVAWDAIRRDAYAKNNYCCWACGVHREYDKEKLRFADESGETLDCHEFYRIYYDKKEMELIEFVALCKQCHAFVHSGRLQGEYDKGRVDEEDCWLVFSHGERVLSNGGLDFKQKEVDTNEYRDEWKDWCLVLDGKRHYSKWIDYFDWYKNYMIG